MDIFKIAVGKFVSLFCILGVRVVNPEVPFCILTKSVQTNELVLFLGRRLVLAPCTFVVGNDASLLDQLSSVIERGKIQLYRCNLRPVAAESDRNRAQNQAKPSKLTSRSRLAFHFSRTVGRTFG